MSVSWTIDTKDGEVTLESLDLLMELLQKSMKATRLSHEELVRTLTEYLQSQGALVKCNPQQLALIAFDVGYFYRVFLDKNDVTVEVPDVATQHDATGPGPT